MNLACKTAFVEVLTLPKCFFDKLEASHFIVFELTQRRNRGSILPVKSSEEHSSCENSFFN